MPIGAVNLAREFLKDPRAPVSERDARAIEERARAAIDAGLDFPIPDFKILAGAGGAVAAGLAISTMPRMPLMGVRMSWLMRRRNSDLAAFARSAPRRANGNTAWKKAEPT